MTLGPGQGVGTGLLCPCPHGLIPGCDGASVLAFARGGSRRQAGRAETGEGALAAAMDSWRDMGCPGAGGSQAGGSCCLDPHPRNAAPPGACKAAEIRKGSGEMGKQERLHRKLGAGWEWLLFHFFSCVNGHNPLKPSCDTAPTPGQSPGLSGTETRHSTSQEASRSSEAKGHRHTQGVAAFLGGGIG